MKHINLTQMLQGCSKRNGMTVSASNPDGEPTVNRQSRLMSLSGKKAEKEQLSPSCLLSASFPLSFRSRYLRYAAMIFCVLAMSFGQAWADDFSAADMVADTGGGTTKNHVNIKCVYTTTTSTKVCNTSVTVAQINSNANASYNGSNSYIEIIADEGYTISSPISITGNAGSTTATPIAIVFWTGTASATFSSVTTATLPSNAATSGCAVDVEVPSGTRTIRIYKQIKYKGNSFSSETGYTQAGNGGGRYYSNITASASPAAAASTWYVKGEWNSWGTTDNLKGSGTELSATVNITTAGKYEFKIFDSTSSGTWWGNGGNIGCNVSGWTFESPGSNCTFFASETGNYTFTFNTSTKKLSVTYPTAQGKYYYKNTGPWSNVAVYRFKGDINNGWPGSIVVETEEICGDTYYFTYADPGTTLIFNNNNGGSQTGNMAASGNAGKYVAGTGNSWTAFTYNVTYDKNGGTGTAPTDATNYSSGASVPVKDNSNLTKSGYYFAGWNTKADGSGTTYMFGETFSITSCTTLYAKWMAVTCPDGSEEGTVFSLTSPTGTVSVPASSSATITSSQATVSKGLATMVNGQSSAKNLINSSKFNFPNGNTVLRLNLGCALAKGDVISFTDANYKLMVSKTNSTSPGTDNYVTQPSKTENCTIPAGSNLIGLKEVYIVRAEGSTTTCTAITITRPAGCTAPTALAASSVTAKGATLTVTDEAEDGDDYEFYVSTSSTAPTAGSSATHTATGSKSITITSCVANTTYYAWARTKCSSSNKSDWVALTGNTFTTSTVTVTHTLTNVEKTSGATTAGGSDYTAKFAAVSGYSMPTPTVTVGGSTLSAGNYTWAPGTGTLTIPAGKINGNIVITLNSVAAAPTSVSVGTQFHYFPGNTITLTATPTGGNGPKTYQWYHGGTADGNAIGGATSATYTKANCEYSDAGSYYCKVTCGGSLSRTSSNFDVKILRLYVNGSRDGDAYDNVDFASTGDDATATASISLGSGWTYGFCIADGCGNYYGNSGTMTEANHSNWTMDRNNSGQCAITTTNAATYTFTVTYYENDAFILGAPKVSVSYPVANQAEDKVIYFDNSVLSWAVTPYYRIGHSTHSQATAMTKVSGTANLYKVMTSKYNGFSGWFIANAEGGTGSYKSIYNTVNTPAITEATAHEGGAVTADAVTVTPTTSKGAGADAGVNDNCTFYNYTITTGMKTDRVTISPYSNGTITVNYTNTSGSAATLTSGNADLAHTCIITPTATPSTGYKLSGLTVNASAHTSGSTYTVTGATTVAATFAAKQSAITFDMNGGTGGAAGTTGTYGSAMTTVTIPTRLGYTFDGYYDAETDNNGSGTKYYNANGTSARTWDKDTESATTLYAKWVEVECPAAGSGETVFKFVPVTSSSDNVASGSGAELTTSDYLSALENGHVYAYGSSASNVTMTSSGVKVASSTGYLKLDFDCALIAGDQIKWKSDQNSIRLCNTTSYNSSNDLELAKSNSSYSTVDITSAMVGKQTLYLVYNTGVATMIYFEIIRPEGYSVTYKANGGTGSDVNRIDATAASLATVGFTRAGYNFTGWKTSASSGTEYAVGDEITEEVTLYAQWTCVTPTFGTNLSTSQVDYEQNATASALTVAATATGDGGAGTVGYQWYSNATNSTAGATPLTGQTSASYTPSTTSLGTMYYYCVATNSSSGCSTTATSNIAKIVVSEAPCFKFVAGTTKGSEPSDNTEITSSNISTYWTAGATLTGGTITNTSGATLGINASYGFVYAASSNRQVTVSLTGDNVLAAGAVITINGYSNNSTDACGFKISGNDMSPATYTPGSAAYTAFTQTYTVTAGSALEGASSFTVDPATSIRVYLNSITVTGCAECTAISPTLTAGTTTLYTYPTATSTTLTLDKDGSMGGVTWTSSDASIASVSGSGTSATVTAVGIGSATITASIATDGTHCAKSVSKTFTVTGGCGYNVIASAVLTSKTAATTSGCTLLASNMSNSSAPYKLDKTLPSYFGLQLSSGSFQVGDSIIFKVKIGDMDINDGTTYPVAVFTSTSTDDKATAIYTSGANTKGSDNVYIRFVVTSGMLTALNTNKQVLIIRNTNIKQNHSMYFAQVKRYVCPEGVFEFNDAAEDGQWSNTDNWVGENGQGIASLPTISNRVIISKPVEVDVTNAKAAEVIIDQKSPRTGTLTIKEGMALIIAGTLKKTTTGTSVVATAAADVIINSTRAAGTGALVMGSHDGTNEATVNFESKVNCKLGDVNQYIGSPFSNEIPYVDYSLQIYEFCPAGNCDHIWWKKLSYGDPMSPFKGYNLLTNDKSIEFVNLNGREGRLNASTNQTMTIGNGMMYYNESWPENMFSNGWLAPIHIDQFEDADFVNVKKVIYLFNAGTPEQYEAVYGVGVNSLGNDDGSDADNAAPGTYTVIPVKSAAELEELGALTTVIPSMQAFSVLATSSSPSLTLDFNRLVYTPATTNPKIEPTRAPKRAEAESEHSDAMRLRVRGANGWTANAYVLGRNDCTNGYDDGWDGEYMEGDWSAPQLYSVTNEGYFVVNCIPEIEGTLMAFHPGRADNTYTFSFVYNGNETWYLNDVKEQKSTLISNETTYPFVSNAGDNAARFVISKIPYTTTEIATGVTNLDDETLDVQKVIYNDKLYIIRGGKVFSADGQLVK